MLGLKEMVEMSNLLKIARQVHPDRHNPIKGIKQWMAQAVDTQLNQLFHTQFHHNYRWGHPLLHTYSGPVAV